MARQRLDILYSEIGKKIASLRHIRGLTQSELADKAGLKRPSVVLVEQGKQRVPVDRLYLIASVLKCQINELLPSVNSVLPGAGKPKELSFDMFSQKNFNKKERDKLIETIKAYTKEANP